MATEFIIPGKISSYFRRLKLHYSRNDQALLDIIENAKVYVREEAEHDNWNGGTSGHDLVLFLPERFFTGVPASFYESRCKRILEDLRTISGSISGEFIANVYIELADQNDQEFREASSTSLDRTLSHDEVTFWKAKNIRVFLSHRDLYKAEAKMLSDRLLDFGISAFVAHDTIEPMSTWQNEIIKGLETMEVMLCFLTDDFHESTWTNQEVGYALGRATPIISLKLQTKDPSGFIGSEQALRGFFNDPSGKAQEIFELIAKKVGAGTRLKEALIDAFVSSPSFAQSKERYKRLTTNVASLNEEELEKIISAYGSNSQLHNCIFLYENNNILNFLNRASGKSFEFEGNSIIESNADDDEIPF